MDGLTTCPRCGTARTGLLWGRPVCLRCRGDAVKLANAARLAARGRAATTAAKIAHADDPPPPPTPRVVVVARTEPVAVAPSTAVPTLRQRLKARRLAERAAVRAGD